MDRAYIEDISRIYRAYIEEIREKDALSYTEKALQFLVFKGTERDAAFQSFEACS
jgi:hypothetical protein